MNYIIGLFQNVDGTLVQLTMSSNKEAFCGGHEVRWWM